MKETHSLSPTDINGVNKLAAEMYYMLYAKVYGMSTISLRLTNTYGPRMDLQNRKRGLSESLSNRRYWASRFGCFGDGMQRRDFNYVSDVTRALALAGEHNESQGECFNIGHHEHLSLLDFVRTLATICPVEYECVPFPNELKAIDIGDYYADYSKFQSLTGWTPQVNLAEGLALTCHFYRQHRQAA